MKLLAVLMHRDGLSKEEAQTVIEEMRQRVIEGADPEDVLNDEGLEPDYFFDIVPTPKIVNGKIVL